MTRRGSDGVRSSRKPKPVPDSRFLAELPSGGLSLADWAILRGADGDEHPVVQRSARSTYVNMIWEDDDLCWSSFIASWPCVRFRHVHGARKIQADAIDELE